VDLDGQPCDMQSSNCQVDTVDYAFRSTYVFLYNAQDEAGNEAEQVVFELVLDDTVFPQIDMCKSDDSQDGVHNATDDFELWEAGDQNAQICSTAVASDNIDDDTVMGRRLRYQLYRMENNEQDTTRVCPPADKTQASHDWENDERWNDYPAVDQCIQDALDTENVGRYLFVLKACDRAGTTEDGTAYAKFHYSANPPYDNCVTSSKAIVIEDSKVPLISVLGEGHTGLPKLHQCGTSFTETYKTGQPYTNECIDPATGLPYDSDSSSFSSNCTGLDAYVVDQLDDELNLLIDVNADILDPSGNVLTSGPNQSPPLDVLKLGVHTIRYNARDSQGLSAAEQTRRVEVKDWSNPTATLIGDSTIVHRVGQSRNCTTNPCYDPWASCTDTCDQIIGAPSASWEGGKVWNERVPGTYVRRYTCTDASTNQHSVTRTIKIVDEGDPIITIMGDMDLTIDASNTVEYTDEGATCNDYVDGVLSHAVEVSGHVVNMQVPGEYQIKYDCIDLAGNPAIQQIRKVTVVDRTCPTIQLKGENTIRLEAGFEYTDAGAEGFDDLDVTTDVTTVNNNIYTENKYHRARSCQEIKQLGGDAVDNGYYFITTYRQSDLAFLRIRVFCDMQYGATLKKCTKTSDSPTSSLGKHTFNDPNNIYNCETDQNTGCGNLGLQPIDWSEQGGLNMTNSAALAAWGNLRTDFFSNRAEQLQYIPTFDDGTIPSTAGSNTYLCSTNDAANPTDTSSYTFKGSHAHDWTAQTKQEEFGKFVISYHTSDSSGNTETHRQEFPYGCTAASAQPNSTVQCAPWSKQPCGSTPKRTVIVVDTLPPVIKLHLKNEDGSGGRLIHTSASHQLGVGGAAYENDAHTFDHTVDYAADEVANSFPTGSAALMAEQMVSTTNGWVLGALASAVTGLALLGYSRRANHAALTVDV